MAHLVVRSGLRGGGGAVFVGGGLVAGGRPGGGVPFGTFATLYLGGFSVCGRFV